MGASLVVEGSTNGTVFETYLEDVVLPTLKRGQVVAMDNLSAHKGERVRELIRFGRTVVRVVYNMGSGEYVIVAVMRRRRIGGGGGL